MSIGVMLLFVYFIVALVDKLSSDTFTWETLWRQFALLLAAKYIMENGFQLLEIIFNIGMATAARVSALGDPSVSETAVDAAAIIDKFTGSFTGFFAIIGELIMMLYLLIPWLLSWIMGLCVSIICYSRVIEIYVRATFAPIALSDFFHSGLHGSGWRYLKSFLAVALQGALILVIGMIYSALFNRTHLKNGNGIIIGAPGSGKSMAAKNEMIQVNLRHPNDVVIVVDPEGEYRPLADILDGEVIRIAPGSGVHLNPFDIELDTEEDNPIAQKSDFIKALMQTIIGGDDDRAGLTAAAASIIDRCVQLVYEPYLQSYDPETKSYNPNALPTLMDFYHTLRDQDGYDATPPTAITSRIWSFRMAVPQPKVPPKKFPW